jgi:dihydrofolate reductase
MLLGRTTYEELAALWPARDGELADRLNSLPKYVVSSTLENPAWNNSTVLSGDAVEEVSRLKRELDGNVVVPGSIRLARTLIEHELVDELRMMVYPVVLGAGERLFGELPDKRRVRLVEATTVGDGIAVLRYETGRGAGL